MSTRSRIGKLNADGTVTSVYCHWDGYPSYNGFLLQQFYSKEEVVDELISHGNLSYLAQKIDPTGAHSFDNPEDDVCVYYGRDRKEPNNEPSISQTVEEYYSSNASCEDYNYLYKPGIGWHVRSDYDGIEELLDDVLYTQTPDI